MLKSVLAVVAGYAVFGVTVATLFPLAARDPRLATSLIFEVCAIIYGTGFAMLSGAVAARIAGRSQVMHAAAVGFLIAVGAVASLTAGPPSEAHWTQWSALLLMAPSALLGGRFQARPNAGE